MPTNGTGNSSLIHRTASGGMETAGGTLYVSKPFRTASSQKLRALIKFVPRKSAFDTTNEASGMNEFRGFFTLFWISMFLWTLRTYITSFETYGHVLNLRFASRFSEDAVTLAISDAILVATTGICVPFAKLISRGWIKYHYTGIIIQHTLQIIILFTAISWTFNRQWPWVQSGFLTLHSLVLIMKMHSYMTVNGSFQRTAKQAAQLETKLKSAAKEFGGYDQAVLTARRHRAQLDTIVHDNKERAENGHSDGTRISYVDIATANILRQRMSNGSQHDSNTSATTTPDFPSTPDTPSSVKNGVPLLDLTKESATTWHPLVDHPDGDLAALAREYSELDSELSSNGPYPVRWPENITVKNFATYMLIPTLVYELEYPRTDRIRPLYVFEKTVATFGTFALLYTVTETFILPLTPTPDQSFFRSLLDLALPFMIAYILLFYIIFECICNGFAELSYFADRQFYEDWWNSTSWDEFSRKWNKPVYSWLLRHVYASTLSSWKVSRFQAMFLTFMVSACAHELVMVVVTQKIRMYLFVMQLIQLPLIAVGRMPVIKRNKLLGNIVFWIGLYAGFPLLCVAYVAY